MSQDELPQRPLSPDSTGDLDAAPTARETSADASAARTPRRRRAVAARELDAPLSESPSEPASPLPPPVSEEAAPKPRRAPRPRKTALPDGASAAEETPVAPVTEVSSSPEEEAPKPARPSRSRRPKAIPDATPAAAPFDSLSQAAAPEVTSDASAVTETPSAAPASTRGRSRRPKPEPLSETPAEPRPETLPQEGSPETGLPSAPASPRSRSRRRTRGTEEVVIAEGVTPIAEGRAISEITLEETILLSSSSSDIEAVPVVEIERGARRRRGGRGRRSRGGEEAVEVPSSLEPAEITVEEVVSDQPETPEEAERSRRSRRGGRGKRTRTSELPTVPAVVARLPEAEPAAEEIAPDVSAVEPEPEIDLSVGVHLVVKNGIPDIQIDGKTVSPLLFFGNLDDQTSRPKVYTEIRDAAKAGIHLHSTLIELPCPLTETSNALDIFDERVRLILEADPDGYVMPRLLFAPARGWRREYPTDISLYADGSTGDPALTSERFWAEAERSLNSLAAHVREHSWGKRIFGYHLERGEWFQPADLGYDRSIANRDAFRDWLRDKYKDNLVSLRAAWFNAEVQFHTAEIPAASIKPDPGRAFYAPRKERAIMDFHEFTSETTALRLTKLAKVLKKATDYNVLVSVCYGYTLEFGHGFSGHLALGKLLDSPHIDLICGPPSYRDRKPGGAASLPSPTGSIQLHGKLWLSEDDTKTYLAPDRAEEDAFNPRMPDPASTEQAHLRSMGKAFVRSTGIGLMDLWGEGWLDDLAIWKRFGEFSADFGSTRALQQNRGGIETPDVVVLVDERSLLHVQRGEPFFRRLTNGLRDTLQRAGIRYEIYLQSDLTHPNFPTDARLYLFATPYRLPIDQRKAISDKLHGGNRTLVWLYAPGTCERRPSFDYGVEEGTGGIIGITLRPQEWNSEVGSRVVAPNHPIFNKLRGRDIGIRERFNPSFYVDDPDAVILAEYGGSGLGSVGVRDHGTWRSVFVGEPALSPDLLRGLCRFANVHRWTQYGDDIVEIGSGWVLVHAVRDGNKALRLPPRVALYDFLEGRLVADGYREHRFFLRGGHTRLFLYGDVSRFEALKLPNLTLPVREQEERAADNESSVQETTLPEVREEALEEVPESLSVSAAPLAEPPAAVPNALREDLATLEAILNMDMDALEEGEDFSSSDGPIEGDPSSAATEEIEEETDPGGDRGDPAPKRRRRGGRGRGRKRVASIDEGKEETVVSETEALAVELTPRASDFTPRPVDHGQPPVSLLETEENEPAAQGAEEILGE